MINSSFLLQERLYLLDLLFCLCDLVLEGAVTGRGVFAGLAFFVGTIDVSLQVFGLLKQFVNLLLVTCLFVAAFVYFYYVVYPINGIINFTFVACIFLWQLDITVVASLGGSGIDSIQQGFAGSLLVRVVELIIVFSSKSL